jgi:hypothetical protein
MFSVNYFMNFSLQNINYTWISTQLRKPNNFTLLGFYSNRI